MPVIASYGNAPASVASRKFRPKSADKLNGEPRPTYARPKLATSSHGMISMQHITIRTRSNIKQLHSFQMQHSRLNKHLAEIIVLHIVQLL